MSSVAPPDLLCMGDALVDLLSADPRRSLDEADTFRRCPGGSALNTAVVASRLGARVAFCSAVGDDPFGRFLARFLRDEGVDAGPLVVRNDGTTGVAFASSPGGRPQFRIIRGGRPPATTLRLAERPRAWLRTARAFHLCSLFSYQFAPASFVRACLDDAARAGTLITFDPNVRDHAITDAAAARTRILDCCARAHVVKLSDEDARWIRPRSSPGAVARRLVRDGAVLAVVTLGAAGSLVARRVGRRVVLDEVAAVRVRVADTVGAGDAYMGGLLAALAQRSLLDPDALAAAAGDEILGACRVASAAAAAVCSGVGALAGLRSSSTVARLAGPGRRGRRSGAVLD